MVNHGLVVVPLFFIIALLAARVGGTDDLRRMGGLAMRAPVLAALFLIVALATLAMPGSANFVGEFLILTGVFKAKIVYAIVAGAGVALAAVYMIRLYQRSMHNPLAPGAESREMSVADAVVIVPIVAVILFLAVYPQFVLERSESDRHHPGDPGDPMNGFDAPYIDYAGISPLIALTAGTCVTLLAGLFRARALVLVTALATLAAAAGLSAWQFGESKSLVEGALRSDDLSLSLSFVFYAAAAIALLLSLGERGDRPSALGDYAGLMLASVTGMVVLASAINLVSLFVGIELLSIPLYVMCALDLHRRTSLESGLKYLVIGSVGSATLLYGLAFIYGASGSTDFAEIARAIGDAGIAGDPLLLTGIALTAAGLAFKASVAPFHQWTPDVYEGAPTSVTAFMAVATKTAAFAILLRLFDTALLPAKDDWDVALAALAVATIAIGNIGAIGQASLKRLLAYSGVAQAGYMLAGVLVATELGVRSVVFYLFVYLIMNMAAFAVVAARERESGLGDHIDSVAGIGATRPGARVAADDRDARACRAAGHGGVPGEVLPDRGGGGRRLHLARASRSWSGRCCRSCTTCA